MNGQWCTSGWSKIVFTFLRLSFFLFCLNYLCSEWLLFSLAWIRSNFSRYLIRLFSQLLVTASWLIVIAKRVRSSSRRATNVAWRGRLAPLKGLKFPYFSSSPPRVFACHYSCPFFELLRTYVTGTHVFFLAPVKYNPQLGDPRERSTKSVEGWRVSFFLSGVFSFLHYFLFLGADCAILTKNAACVRSWPVLDTFLFITCLTAALAGQLVGGGPYCLLAKPWTSTLE